MKFENALGILMLNELFVPLGVKSKTTLLSLTVDIYLLYVHRMQRQQQHFHTLLDSTLPIILVQDGPHIAEVEFCCH